MMTPRSAHIALAVALAATSWPIALAAADSPAGTPAATPPRPNAEQARAFVRSLLVKSPYRMSAQARAGEIRYRLRFEPAQDWAWPETGEQRVIRDARGIELRICDDCGREPPPAPEILRRYLQPNPWVQSDDRRIRSFARANNRGGSVDARMRALTVAVRRHMTGAIDYRDYHDAVTALETRSGDCTEYALLLAAAARAVGIPARLAHGLAYSSRFTGEPHVFSPHVWVQVWDGRRWVSHDAGLLRFDAGHIALYIGDGSPDALRPLAPTIRSLRIEDAAGILPAATAAGE
jgi:transglutaminase-like putative cysteine protease